MCSVSPDRFITSFSHSMTGKKEIQAQSYEHLPSRPFTAVMVLRHKDSGICNKPFLAKCWGKSADLTDPVSVYDVPQ